MARSPFRLTGHTCLSFSGGRTSAYMLWRVLQDNPPEDLARWLQVCFANTGKEHPSTLDFVRDVGEAWQVPIAWLEYRQDPATRRQHVIRVDYASASRQGEPFAQLIAKKKFLPNPVNRLCTAELKIRTIARYLKGLGWTKHGGGWDQMIGIRGDEYRRIAKIRGRAHSSESKHELLRLPLVDAGITVQDVGAFWQAQAFDLALPAVNGKTVLGNCDLCFLKSRGQLFSIIASDRSRAAWWVEQEHRVAEMGRRGQSCARFRSDRPTYTEMLAYAELQLDLFDPEDDSGGIDCFCGD